MPSDAVVNDAPMPRAYASFTARMRAVVADLVVWSVCLVLIMLIPDIPGSGRVMELALLALCLLYEPILVWRYGGTIGHRFNRLRVVSDDTGGNPSFPRAFLRFVIKSVLGVVSFMTMAVTARHQAMHDSLTSTTMQIRDPSRVRSYDIVWERPEEAVVGLPSRRRRITIIVLYETLLYLAAGAANDQLLSDACAVTLQCSPAERIRLGIVSVAYLAAVFWILVYGWRGRLFGARAAVAPAGSSAKSPV
jgi:uncharacterized RDD family membrane protein YckC